MTPYFNDIQGSVDLKSIQRSLVTGASESAEALMDVLTDIILLEGHQDMKVKSEY